jgi:hypothetical protein
LLAFLSFLPAVIDLPCLRSVILEKAVGSNTLFGAVVVVFSIIDRCKLPNKSAGCWFEFSVKKILALTSESSIASYLPVVAPVSFSSNSF